MRQARGTLLVVLVLALVDAIPAVDISSLETASSVPVTASFHEDGSPRFIRGQWAAPSSPDVLVDPLGAAKAFIGLHTLAFGLSDPNSQLALVASSQDTAGRIHVRLAQRHSGVTVFGAQILLHYRLNGDEIYAINGKWSPDLAVSVSPQTSADEALTTLRRAYPKWTPVGSPSLTILGDELAWNIVLEDPSIPGRRRYLVSALDGQILEWIDLIETARNRNTYDANHGSSLPGTLERTESDPAVGDADVDSAHDVAGETYDYYQTEHGRDSYDNGGATLTSSAHFQSNYKNAYWNSSQVVYGDNMATRDIGAHEWTHALTEHTAGLVYKGESGALNESFSDIFGAMVDNDDWLMGEGSAVGVIRSLEDPPKYGQPDHIDGYVCTRSDNGGVHKNSGIQNKAAYLLSTQTTRADAGAIFYNSLTSCMNSCGTHLDARDCAVLAAEQIYGAGSTEAGQTMGAFASVGLDANSTGVSCPCACGRVCGCLLRGVVRANTLSVSWSEWARLAATVYRLRDEVMSRTAQGSRMVDLYYQHSDSMLATLASSPQMTDDAAQLLLEIEPGVGALVTGGGQNVVVTQEVVDLATQLLDAFSNDDPNVAKAIAEATKGVDLQSLVGETYGDAANQLLGVPRQIPALSGTGMIALGALLVLMSLIMLRRRLAGPRANRT